MIRRFVSLPCRRRHHDAPIPGPDGSVRLGPMPPEDDANWGEWADGEVVCVGSMVSPEWLMARRAEAEVDARAPRTASGRRPDPKRRTRR